MSTISTELRNTKQLIKMFRLNGGLVDKESIRYLTLEEDKGIAQVAQDVDVASGSGIIRPRSGTVLVRTSTLDTDNLHLFKNLRLGNRLIFLGVTALETLARIYSYKIDTAAVEFLELKRIIENELEKSNFNYPIVEIDEDWKRLNLADVARLGSSADILGVVQINLWGEDVELEVGNILLSSGKNTGGSYPNHRRTDGYIEIEALTAYAVSAENIWDGKAYWFFYDTNKTYISNSGNFVVTATSPANAVYVRLVMKYTEAVDPFIVEPFNLMLQQGTTVSPYSPRYTRLPMFYQDTGLPFTEGTKFYFDMDYLMSSMISYNDGDLCKIDICLFNDINELPVVVYEYTETTRGVWQVRKLVLEITETLPGTIKFGIQISFNGLITITQLQLVQIDKHYWLADLTLAQLEAHPMLYNWFETTKETEEDYMRIKEPHQFLSFADALVGVSENNRSFVWDGLFASEPPEFPMAKYMCEYRNRIALSGIKDNPTMIKLCHTGDPYLWNPHASNSNAVEMFVSPDDGEPITGHVNMGDSGLLITKRNRIYGLFGYVRSNFTIELLESSIGSVSHNSLRYLSPYVYFLHDSGVYRMEVGKPPEDISMGISKYFREPVDLSSVRSFVYKRNYVLFFKSTGGESHMFIFSPDSGSIAKWTVDATTFGDIRSIIAGDLYGEFYLLNSADEIRKSTTDSIADRTKSVAGVLHTMPLTMGLPEVDKDYTDLYVFANSTGTTYTIRLSIFIDEVEVGVPVDFVVAPVPLGYTQRKRITIGRTGRALSVKFEFIPTVDIVNASQFALLGFSYTAQPKDVL